MRYARGVVAAAFGVVALFIGGSTNREAATRSLRTPVWTPVAEQVLSHGRFDKVWVYVPHSTPRGFVVFLSGAGGWTRDMSVLAERLAAQGALVAGIDVTRFNTALAADGGQCVYPDGDLENLSRFVQAYFRLPGYLEPILAGYAAGATLAYATLVQAPTHTFAGAVSLDFCPNFELNKPLCTGSGLASAPRPDGRGVDFLPTTVPGNSWTVVQRASGLACDGAAVRGFVGKVPGSAFIALPDAAAQYTAYTAAVAALMERNPAPLTAAVPAVLGDLPLVAVPAQPGTPASDTFAIVLSGDGGWAGLDKDVAGALAMTGIPVIGLDSLRYFWSARTPAGLAADLERMIGYYLPKLGKRHVLLIGYSQGADVLPFAVNLLSAGIRSHVALAAVMGMSEHALFEFHMTNWVSDDNSGPATLPEVDKIAGIPVLCIYGADETDTLCPKLDPHKVTIVKLKGGHHFDGDYPALARLIMKSAAPR